MVKGHGWREEEQEEWVGGGGGVKSQWYRTASLDLTNGPEKLESFFLTGSFI
jgi:hypothetical protein